MTWFFSAYFMEVYVYSIVIVNVYYTFQDEGLFTNFYYLSVYIIYGSTIPFYSGHRIIIYNTKTNGQRKILEKQSLSTRRAFFLSSSSSADKYTANFQSTEEMLQNSIMLYREKEREWDESGRSRNFSPCLLSKMRDTLHSRIMYISRCTMLRRGRWWRFSSSRGHER